MRSEKLRVLNVISHRLGWAKNTDYIKLLPSCF